MKILMFGWEFPPYNSGGLGVACWGMTRALSRLGIEVTFVLPRTVPVDEAHCRVAFADKGVPMKVLPVDSLLYAYATSEEYSALRSSTRGMYGPTLVGEVVRYGTMASAIAHEEDHDVIHAHDWLSYPAGLAAKRVSGKPLVVHVHATEFDRSGGGSVNQEVYEIEKAGFLGADRIVAVSQFTKDIVITRYGIPEEKVMVVHNGIDEEDFIGEINTPRFLQLLKEDGTKIVLFVGRLTVQKGPDYFVELAHRVLTRRSDVHFVVSGSGDMERAMIEAVARRGISAGVTFTGFLRGAELSAVYRSADLYVMPSVSEPFGIAPLEAALSGAPVLLSRQAGVSEVFANALRADFWDVDAMEHYVLGLLDHPAMSRTIKHESASEVRSITWKKAGDKLVSLYQTLIP